jgi:hypothetical protein
MVTDRPDLCSDCGHGEDRHAIWGPVPGCYACRACCGWNPPATLGERRGSQTRPEEGTTPDSDWTIREWDGVRWVDVRVVQGDAARDAALARYRPPPSS